MVATPLGPRPVAFRLPAAFREQVPLLQGSFSKQDAGRRSNTSLNVSELTHDHEMGFVDRLSKSADAKRKGLCDLVAQQRQPLVLRDLESSQVYIPIEPYKQPHHT